ncbi:MAG: hypothetical protein IBX57_01075 [Gammaproteobacteria bacterium]|nr:hypothetical protein [Gammaproteobacteria bacterium]
MSDNKQLKELLGSDDNNITSLTDDDLLKFTQSTRLKLVKSLHDPNGKLPSDPKEQRVLLTALSDMDKAALGNKKIGASEKQSASDALVAQAIAGLSSRFGSQNPFMDQAPEGGTKIPSIETEKLPEVSPLPGETDIGLSTETYKTFSEKFED